jgi:predicted ATP-dependent serine protease
MLGALERWHSGPERTPDGRAYICRECGKEYPVTLRFCDGCGAWPGQSG